MKAIVYQKGFGVCKYFLFHIADSNGKSVAKSCQKYKTTEDARRILTSVLSIDPSQITYQFKG